MKGVIPLSLGEMVVKNFGPDKWTAILRDAGLPANTSFMATDNTDDAQVSNLIKSSCKVLNLSLTQAAEAFGEYWCTDFAPRIYKPYYRGAKGAKDFLMKMKGIHEQVTATIPNAKPPVFNFEDPGPNKLIMTYASPRHLEEIWVGLVKGVGKHFKEKLSIRRMSAAKIEITFA